MGRRKRESLFEAHPDLIDIPMSADPPEDAERAEDEKEIEPKRPFISNLKPPKKEKRELTPEEKSARAARIAARKEADKDRSLRDRVRERAAKKQFARIKLYEDLVESPATPPLIRMEAAKRLDEMAIDKTPTAQTAQSNQKRLLVGRAGEGVVRSGGDHVPVTVEDITEGEEVKEDG